MILTYIIIILYAIELCLSLRPFPQHARFSRYNSRGRRSKICLLPDLIRDLKVNFAAEYDLLEELLGDKSSDRLRKRVTRCELPDGYNKDVMSSIA